MMGNRSIRQKFITGSICLLFLGVSLRLAFWQLVSASSFKAQAASQRTAETKSLGQRGNILFSDSSTLAGSKISYLLFADKKFVKDPRAISTSLALLFSVPEASLSAKLNQDLMWIPLIPLVSGEMKAQVEKLDLSGLGFDKKEIRFYPESSMAANLVGFVGKDNAGRDKGYFGLEGFYNSTLEGKEGITIQETDVMGRPILSAGRIESAPKRGATLQLSIDRTVQYIAEKRLKEGIEKFGAEAGDVVIMDPQTGFILAMATYPTYNPATYFEASASAYKNPIVSETYEPGSTFKSMIMAAAINENAVKPETTCPCDKPSQIGGFTINSWDNKVRPNVTMNDVLKNSDNNGMIFVGERIGKEKTYRYLETFGFGKATNIDVQNEEVQPLRTKKDWYPIDYATVTFGQGIAVTPIQLVQAYAAIANGGKLLEPRVVKKIITDKKDIDIKPKVIREVLKNETTKTVTQMLVYTVDNGEAGRLYKPKGFKVAAKSGTAQVPIAGRYDNASNVISSYAGFAPAENPRFVALVRFKKPRGGGQGATTAGPVFYNIAKDLFAYWGITPSE